MYKTEPIASVLDLPVKSERGFGNPLSDFTGKSNTEAIGSVLYTDYILYFQLSGVILLVAMIGSIVLTLREREGVKRQVVSEQLQRQGKIDLVDVKSGKGVDV